MQCESCLVCTLLPLALTCQAISQLPRLMERSTGKSQAQYRLLTHFLNGRVFGAMAATSPTQSEPVALSKWLRFISLLATWGKVAIVTAIIAR